MQNQPRHSYHAQLSAILGAAQDRTQPSFAAPRRLAGTAIAPRRDPASVSPRLRLARLLPVSCVGGVALGMAAALLAGAGVPQSKPEAFQRALIVSNAIYAIEPA